MIKRYNVRAGLIFSVAISTMATILPRIIRLEVDQPRLILNNFIYLWAIFFICWLAHHFFLLLDIGSGFFSHRMATPVISIICSVFLIGIFTNLFNLGTVIPINRNPGIGLYRGQILFIRLFRGVLISACTYFAVYYFRLMLILQQSKVENEYLKQGNLQAQLGSLRQQISPHFLFNSLNTLSTLSHDEAVKEYILKMSEVYRYVLHYQERTEVPVEEALAFIRSYIYILESRFEEGLKINIRVDRANCSRKILPFALQLLVENAVKHNAISYSDPLVIDIYDRNDALVVENDLRPRVALDASSGTGLSNLAQRYRLAAAKEILITRNTAKFKVEIPFLL